MKGLTSLHAECQFKGIQISRQGSFFGSTVTKRDQDSVYSAILCHRPGLLIGNIEHLDVEEWRVKAQVLQ